MKNKHNLFFKGKMTDFHSSWVHDACGLFFPRYFHVTGISSVELEYIKEQSFGKTSISRLLLDAKALYHYLDWIGLDSLLRFYKNTHDWKYTYKDIMGISDKWSFIYIYYLHLFPSYDPQ